MKLLRILLFPIAILYDLITRIRNVLFDWKILPSKLFSIPVISVGNLSVGGTGKTPHVDYLVNLLTKKYKIATLSRGYGRKTHGFIIANENSTDIEIGDEPLLFLKKYPSLTVSVDGKRVRGIKRLLKAQPDLEVILLDDAYQHRYVKPGLSILLTDYFRLYSSDYVVPSGHLRECRSGANRADIIIVTKTPKVFSPLDKRYILDKLKPRPHQSVFFSYISYGKFEPFFENQNLVNEIDPSKIVMFAGIANPVPFEEFLKRHCNELISIRFRDHHAYTVDDIRKIKLKFESIYSGNKIIVTTQKDKMRLYGQEFVDVLKDLPIYYVPIDVEFHKNDAHNSNFDFDTVILDFLQKTIS